MVRSPKIAVYNWSLADPLSRVRDVNFPRALLSPLSRTRTFVFIFVFRRSHYTYNTIFFPWFRLWYCFAPLFRACATWTFLRALLSLLSRPRIFSLHIHCQEVPLHLYHYFFTGFGPRSNARLWYRFRPSSFARARLDFPRALAPSPFASAHFFFHIRCQEVPLHLYHHFFTGFGPGSNAAN